MARLISRCCTAIGILVLEITFVTLRNELLHLFRKDDLTSHDTISMIIDSILIPPTLLNNVLIECVSIMCRVSHFFSTAT